MRPASEHFRLVLGYDARADEVIYHDPAVEQGANLRMPRSKFLSLWPVNSGTADPLVVVLRLEPGRLKPAKASDTFTAADYAQHIMRLKKRVPGQGFTIVLEPPFIVLGDQSPELVRGHSEKTVKWAVDRLKRAYFHKDPREILDVWLFRDKSSYEQNCQTVFGQRADDSVRVLLAHRRGVGDEHRNWRRHARARDRSPLYGRQLPRLPGMVQRGDGLALRTVRRREW